jgi:hypothetical protein
VRFLLLPLLVPIVACGARSDLDLGGTPAGAEPGTHEIVLVGQAGGATNETWTFDGSSWTKLPVAGPITAGSGAAASVGGKVVLAATEGPEGATWAFDGTAWATLGITGPSARVDGVAATVGGSLVSVPSAALEPPATRTRPSGRKSALARSRPWASAPAGENIRVAGSYHSASGTKTSPLGPMVFPPTTSTRATPGTYSVTCPKRGWSSVPPAAKVPFTGS